MNDKKIILGINRGHNSSVTLMHGDQILFHLENERLTNLKYDNFSFNAINLVPNYVDYIDCLVIAGVSPINASEVFSDLDYYSEIVLRLKRSFYDHGFERYDFSNDHHKLHAACAFYNSGFDSALCVIKDGMGSEYKIDNSKFTDNTYGRENGTSFVVSDNIFNIVNKHIGVNFTLPDSSYYISDTVFLSNTFSEGLAFQKTAKLFNFHELDAGKVMGMSAYGTPGRYQIYNNNLLNTDIFKFKDNNLTQGYVDINLLDSFADRCDFACDLQLSIQKNILQEILGLLDKTRQKNLCLSGGFFLNCVANYYILKNLPKDINVYVEPLSNDAGTSLGAALLVANMFQKSKQQKSIYYGPTHNYTVNSIKNLCKGYKITENVNSDYVAGLLTNKKIIAMYQGSSESGPRALGNRSILYDPRDNNGKDKINQIKRREEFRPFAATVLHEKSSDWFEMHNLEESKYMMFAVDAKKDKKSLIPAVLHIDNTCRIQTLKLNDNSKFYKLIQSFYRLTSIPMLLNTSFNLAGDCIVETLEDALNTLSKSQIDYLYLPEFDMCISC